MWRKQVSSAVIVCLIGISSASAGLILTIDGSNPTGIPLMLSGTGPYQVALDGNTTIEPNDIRFEAVGGTLTVISDVNHQYSFQYAPGSTAGFVWLITNTALTIDDINVPADTTIYELFIFCNPDVNLTGACGSDLSFFFPPQEEEEGGGQGESMIEEPAEQSGTGETMPAEETGESQSSIASYDPSWDFDGNGIVNFNDFAIIGAGWQTTYDIYDLNSFCSAFGSIDCCADNSVLDPADNNNWQIINWSGIGPYCSGYFCDEGQSNSEWDNCEHRVYKQCLETSDLDFMCAFNYFYNGVRVGLCVYLCGQNRFQVLKNVGGCRYVFTRHRTHDVPPQDPCCYPDCPPECDEGTIGYYNWQIVLYYTITGERTGYCLKSLTKPTDTWGWQPWEGQSGPCKYPWW